MKTIIEIVLAPILFTHYSSTYVDLPYMRSINNWTSKSASCHSTMPSFGNTWMHIKGAE